MDNTFMILARGDEAEFDFNVVDNSFIVTVYGFKASFVSENTRVREKLISVAGRTEVVVHNVTISCEMRHAIIPANDTNTTGRYITGITSGFMSVLANRDQVDFTFGGDVMASFLSLFQSFYKDLMISVVEESMVESLILEIPLIVNYESLAIDGYAIAFTDENPKFE